MRLEDAKHELEVAQRQGQYERASQLRFGTIPDLERQLPKDGELKEDNAEGPLAMLHDRVTSNDISRVIAKATGIPVQNLLRGEREKLVHVSHFSLLLIHSDGTWCDLDGRCAQATRRWTRSCCIGRQRRCPNLASRSTGPKSTGSFVLVPWAHWCRQGSPSFIDSSRIWSGLKSQTELSKALAAFLFNDEQRGL